MDKFEVINNAYKRFKECNKDNDIMKNKALFHDELIKHFLMFITKYVVRLIHI